MYYLQSRYYNPEIGRFINADGFASTGQGPLGNNMFVYCGNNPVIRVDPSGNSWLVALVVIAASAIVLSGCSANTSEIHDSLASTPDLDITSADPSSYNCYGNAMRKQVLANPSGYQKGDSTEKTFAAVVQDLGGEEYVRRLNSINDPIADDEYLVAIKCGPTDYHFIRKDANGWYNKSGRTIGVYIEQSWVEAEIWYPIYYLPGYGVVVDKSSYYDDATIYFAVKVRWDE